MLEGLAHDYPEVATYSEFLARSRTNLAATLSELGRNVEALAIARAAEPVADRRVRTEPGVVQHRIDLAFIVLSQGIFSMGLRRARRGREAVPPIARDPGADPGHGPGESRGATAISQFLQPTRPDRARPGPPGRRAGLVSATIDLFQPGPAAAPAKLQDRVHLVAALRGRFRAEIQLGRINEALADWDRISTLDEPEEKGRRPLGPILVRAWSGDAAGFLAGGRQAVESGSVPVEELITLAEAAAQAGSRAGADSALPASVRTRQADELASQAVGWLERASGGGLFPQVRP